MEELISSIINNITSIMQNIGIFSGFFLIVIESMLPILPLGVFVALNIATFGTLPGVLISWVATVIGCMLMFFICRKLKVIFEKKYNKNKKINNFKKKIDNLSFSSLVIILAIPFTPAFAVNIGAGLSDISPKKYVVSLIIGKIPMIYFWGFIGKTFIESFSDITVVVQILFMLFIAYLVSKLVNKFLNI